KDHIYAVVRSLELRAHSRGHDRHRSSIAVERRIDDELIVCRQLPRPDRKAVVAFDNRFHSRMWELPIADENAEAACRQVRAMHLRDAIDDCSNAERVVSPAPSLTGDRHASRRGPIDVRELVRFDAAIGPAAAREYADIGSDLLGNVHVHARTTVEAAD